MIEITPAQAEEHGRISDIWKGFYPYSGTRNRGDAIGPGNIYTANHQETVEHRRSVTIAAEAGRGLTVSHSYNTFTAQKLHESVANETFMIVRRGENFQIDHIKEAPDPEALVEATLSALENLLVELESGLEAGEFIPAPENTPAPPEPEIDYMDQFLNPPNPFRDLPEAPPLFVPIDWKQIMQNWKQRGLKLFAKLRKVWKGWGKS